MKRFFLFFFSILTIGCTQSFLDNFNKNFLNDSPSEDPDTPVYSLTRVSVPAKEILNTIDAVLFKSKIFYVGFEDNTGHELWMMDRDTQNRKLVRDINPGSKGSQISQIKKFDDLMFFWADDGKHGLELWRSDGTSEGTYLLHEFYSGQRSVHSDDDLHSFEMVKLGAYYYFTAMKINSEADPVPTFDANGKELWRTNGIDSVEVIANYENSAVRSNPEQLTVFDNKVYFFADLPSYGHELFYIDNSLTTPEMVNERVAGTNDSYSVNAKLKVFANNLFVSNVSVAGAGSSAYDGSNFTDYSEYLFLNAEFNNNLYFSADTGNGDELHHISSGDITTLVEDLDINGSGASYPGNLKSLESEGVVFSYDLGGSSFHDQLAFFNGTSAVDIVALESNGYFNYSFETLKNSVIFKTNLTNGPNYIFNISGGSVSKTITLSDHLIGLSIDEIVIYQNMTTGKIYSYNVVSDQSTEISSLSFPTRQVLSEITPFKGELIYKDANSEQKFYISNNSSSISLEPSGWFINASNPNRQTKNYMYYGLRNGSMEGQLGRTDGSSQLDLLLPVNANNNSIGVFAATDSKVLYTADKGSGSAIHCYDENTDTHTDVSSSLGVVYNNNNNQFYIDFNEGFLISAGTSFTDSKLYYIACDGVGSQLIKDIHSSSSDQVSHFVKDPKTGNVYFAARDDSNEYFIYVTDGTPSGTTQIDPSTSYSSFFYSDLYISKNNELYVCGTTLDKYDLDTMEKTAIADYTSNGMNNCSEVLGELNSGKIVLEGMNADKHDLFIYDPNTNEHQRLTTHLNVKGSYGVSSPHIHNNFIYYHVNDGVFGGELWRIHDDNTYSQDLLYRGYNGYDVTMGRDGNYVFLSRNIQYYYDIFKH